MNHLGRIHTHIRITERFREFSEYLERTTIQRRKQKKKRKKEGYFGADAAAAAAPVAVAGCARAI